MTKLDEGYCKAQSDNLPDSFMIADFFSKSDSFSVAESRGAKQAKSGRETYGDAAIGYVQLKRDGKFCEIKCRICPEHKVRGNNYTVTVKVDEEEAKVLHVRCHDCAAAAGGCKHAVAVLMWLHRRSEEPSPTEVDCYWKKPKLSSMKFLTLADLGGTKPQDSACNFLENFVQASKSCKSDASLLKLYDDQPSLNGLSLHILMLDFVAKGGQSYSEFCEYPSQQMSETLCKQAERMTVGQHESHLWHELRYGRVTASKAYAAGHCSTAEGTLVEQIIGALKVRDTMQMEDDWKPK